MEVWVSSHASFFNMAEKYAKLEKRGPGDPNPFIDPEGYKAHVAQYEKSFEAALANPAQRPRQGQRPRQRQAIRPVPLFEKPSPRKLLPFFGPNYTLWRLMRITLGLLPAVPAMFVLTLAAQNTNDTANDSPDAHFAAAKAAAGEDFQNLFNFQCYGPGPGGQRGPAAGARGQGGPGRGAGRGGGRAGGPRQPPDRSTWYAEPVKVFDNLYFFGQSEYAVWAITTSEGIIVLDTIFDYSVEDEVAGGMKKLGLDPANIKYAIVSHAHPDHDGGAKFLQDHYGTRVIMSPADWDVLDKRTNGTKPKRDHRGHRRPETHSRRHHRDALHHAGSYAGHHLHCVSGKGQRDAAPCGSVGRGGAQSRPGIRSRNTSGRRSDSAAS